MRISDFDSDEEKVAPFCHFVNQRKKCKVYLDPIFGANLANN